MRKIYAVFIFLVMVAVLFAGYGIYTNYYYITTEFKDSNKISLLNYRELPKMVESWPGSVKLLSENTNRYRRELYGNEPVKSVRFSRNQLTASLSFAKPDLEDDVAKRSAVITYAPHVLDGFPTYTMLNERVIFAVVRPKGGIIGKGYQRSRIQLELVDAGGKIMRGPKIPLAPDGEATYLILRPTMAEPIPTGSAWDGFDPTDVRKINILFTLGRYPDGVSQFPAQGELVIDNIYLVSNIDPIVKFFGSPSRERVTKDNLNIAYKWHKSRWEKETHEFFVSLNYPWDNYGWDVGKNPYGGPPNSGWSAKEKKLREDLTYLKNAGVEPVRIYVFFDLRTGLQYENGKLVGFDEYVRPDIEAMIKVAGEVGIKILPVLFDFGIADGNGKGVGEHPELIFSSDKYYFLGHMMRPLLQDIEKWNNQYGKPIYALELMNEPENMAALIIPGYFQSLKVWFQDLANIIHNETSLKVTLGAHTIVDMQRWWHGVDIDIWQFHFYKYMFKEHQKWPHNVMREDINIPGPMFVGEMEPFDMVKNIEAVKNNGYSGILFWAFNSTDGFELRGNKKLDEMIAWIAKQKSQKVAEK